MHHVDARCQKSKSDTQLALQFARPLSQRRERSEVLVITRCVCTVQRTQCFEFMSNGFHGFRNYGDSILLYSTSWAHARSKDLCVHHRLFFVHDTSSLYLNGSVFSRVFDLFVSAPQCSLCFQKVTHQIVTGTFMDL